MNTANHRQQMRHEGQPNRLTGDRRQALFSLGPVPMTADTRLRVKLGGATFHVQSVPAPRRAATAPIGLDGRVGAFLAASAIAHLGVLALLRTVPAEQETASRDDGSSELIELRGQMASIEDRVPEPTTTPDGDGGTQDGANAARMALESGTMGSTDARPDPGKRQVKNDGDPSVARHQALQAAREAGILGSSTMRGDLFASIAGNGDLTSGMDSLDFDGGWDGTGTGAPKGFGNGPSGFGPGGGGNDWNSVWSGNYNTISRGPNSGDSYSLDGGDGKPGRKHKPTAPAVKFCTTDNSCNVSGEVDPAVIRRYIKRNTAKITYCYERALLGKPGLTGTVQAIFTVAPNGHVLQSSAKGVDPEVSSCVAEVIGNIQFPKFDEAFQVKYDFSMRPTGS